MKNNENRRDLSSRKTKQSAYAAKKIKTTDALFVIILALAVFVRIYRFGSLPDGVNQDEAYAGYEAWSLLNYGKDSFGYRFPVYFISWGSGMNVLNSYLMIPFIAVFGLKTWVIRMPQVIVAILSVIASYFIMKRLFDERAGLAAMLILAVAPWHVMLSRWGLESNLAPGFLIFGMYFFIKGMDRQAFYIASAAMYGLSLYCYAAIWPIVPFIVASEAAYAVYKKRMGINKYAVISFLVLLAMALPLILFMLVNLGVIGEIRLGFVSIPKLLYMRSGEFSLKAIPANLKNILDIMIKQTDGMITNVYRGYGIIYKITLVFFLFGLAMSFFRIVVSRKKSKIRKDAPQILLLVQFFAGFALTLFVSVNINRANSMMIPMILIAAYGIYELMEMAGTGIVATLTATAYLVLFANFAAGYFKSYNEDAGYAFCTGLGDAISFAMEYASDEMPKDYAIYVSPTASHSRVMFYSRIPVDEYIDTVVYNNYPSAYMSADSFGRFKMSFDAYSPDKDGVYVLDAGTDTSAFEKAGFKIERFGLYETAVPAR